MKTKELIEKVENLGFKVLKRGALLIVAEPNYLSEVVTVRIDRMYHLDSRWDHSALDKEILEKALSYTVDYARTPLEEREEEKKYRIELKNDVVKYNSNGSYLNLKVEEEEYMFSSENENLHYKTKFTIQEIDNFPDEVKEILPLCEKIEVTP